MLDVGASYGLVGLARFLPTSSTRRRPKHHPTGQPLIGRPLYGPRKEEAKLADTRLNALALCFLEGLGVRHGVVSALSARKVNDPWEEAQRECSWPTHPYNRVSITSVFSICTAKVKEYPIHSTASAPTDL